VKPLGDSKTHFWLAQRMAKITETDLVQAMEKAKLTQADWAEMVSHCRGCDWVSGCERWLGKHSDDVVEKAPGGCVNREKFLSLKQALDEVET
jgi:sulfatase maturation enzyme AslB (radical SAM superfamily)